MGWFSRSRAPMAQSEEKRSKAPEGLWIKCQSCSENIYSGDLEKNCNVCPKCDFHFRVSARKRLELIFDEGSFVEHDAGMISVDVLEFKDTKSYADRIEGALKKGAPGMPLSAAKGGSKGCRSRLRSSISPSWGGAWGAWWGRK